MLLIVLIQELFTSIVKQIITYLRFPKVPTFKKIQKYYDLLCVHQLMRFYIYILKESY